MDELLILSNSPGEVSGWMEPVARALDKRGAELSLTAVTLPCPYASGREGAHARTLPGVTDVLTLREAIRRKYRKNRRIILQLGGDPMFGHVLSLKTRSPWMIYSARPRWRRSVHHYFVPNDEALARFDGAGIAETRRTVVGNLILDSVPDLSSLNVADFRARYNLTAKYIICFMPGSRPFEYMHGVPFYAECARLICKKYPEWQAVMPLAPTVDEDRLKSGLDKYGVEWHGDNIAEELRPDGECRIPLVRGRQYEAIASSTAAVAFPGTNNLQIAALGVPLISVAPLNEAQNVPLDGIAGSIPQNAKWLRKLKKRIVLWYNAKEKYVSLPNRSAGEQLVPEIRELMTPESACANIEKLIESEELREKIAGGYSRLDLRRGASSRIADKICEFFGKR